MAVTGNEVEKYDRALYNIDLFYILFKYYLASKCVSYLCRIMYRQAYIMNTVERVT